VRRLARSTLVKPRMRPCPCAHREPVRNRWATSSGNRFRNRFRGLAESKINNPYGPREKGSIKKIMNTFERQFPTEEKVDQWIETHLFGDAEVDGSPELDQLAAAARETTSRWMGAGPGLVAAGHADTFFGGERPERSSPLLHGAVREYLAAASAGITRLCDHTYLIRPLAMNCDPPTIACSDCVTTGAVALIGTADFQWDNQCDRCGAHETQLTPTLLRLGHMTISGHVCRRCADEDQDHALKRA
jgi:hypothetical protein